MFGLVYIAISVVVVSVGAREDETTPQLADTTEADINVKHTLEIATEPPSEFCPFIEIGNVKWRGGVSGIYGMQAKNKTCNKHVIYQQENGINYIFFVNGSGWQGWMIGSDLCQGRGYMSVGDSAWFLDDLTAVWEEYDGAFWVYNYDAFSRCHVPEFVVKSKRTGMTGVTMNLTLAAVTWKTTTSTEDTSEKDELPYILRLILYAAVPIAGCIAVFLVILLCVLAKTNKSLSAELKDEENQMKAFARLRSPTVSVDRHVLAGDKRAHSCSEDLRVLEQPDDAVSQCSIPQ